MSFLLSFDPPILLTATLTVGFVDIPGTIQGNGADRGWDNTPVVETTTNVSSPSGTTMTRPLLPPPVSLTTCGPPSLERRQTMSGNILVITSKEDGNSDNTTSIQTPCAFWLQRKLGKTKDGTIRLGYQLKQQQPTTGESSSFLSTKKWELVTDPTGRHTMVTIHIHPSSVLNDTCVTSTSSPQDIAAFATTVYSPLNELSILQHIAQHNNDGNVTHIVGTDLIASSSKNVYAVLPYHRDGTLLDFCQKVGTLPEPLARFFVRQIVQGLKTLQDAGLCHRNLSLDAILLDENHVDISKLGWAMQFNPTAALDANRPLPPPGGLDPHCIAPEYFSSMRGCWNGFSADLWMTGLIVFSMVIGSDALFATPVAEDKSFARICIKGDIRGQALRYGSLIGRDLSGLSDDLTDLLEKMLRADPEQRLSLQQVMEHPWLMAEEVMTATEYLNTTSAISIGSHSQDS